MRPVIELTPEQVERLEATGTAAISVTTVNDDDTAKVGMSENTPAVSSSTGLAEKAARAARRLGAEAYVVADLRSPWPEAPPRPCALRRKLPRARRIRPGLRRRHRGTTPTRGDPDEPPPEPELHPALARLIADPEAWDRFWSALDTWERRRREVEGEQ
jgi:hypothetical protein